MNILFVDIDGVLNSYSYDEVIVERMIKVLSDICKEYNCKVVISSTHKPQIEYFEESPIITKLNEKLEKYNIECLGFTPIVEIHKGYSLLERFKDFEILYYLGTHPNIEHFAVIDDNDFYDLRLLKEYLVETKDYVLNHPEEEGLLLKHIDEVGKILKKENKYKNLYTKN